MTDRFLGLTKQQFLVLLGALNLALVLVVLLLVVKVEGLAGEGAESHKALCVLKGDYRQRLAENEAYLHLSRAERVAKYGESLGTIPDATIQSSIHNLRANIDSLSNLHCGG